MIKNKKIKNILLLAVSILIISPILLISNLTLAQGVNDEILDELGNFDTGLQYNSEPQEIIITIINSVLGFIGLLLLVIILYSGFEWMTSGGNEEKISKARKRLTSAIIGLGIVMGSWIIAQTIILIIQGGDINWTPWWA